MNLANITPLVITYNEAPNIGRCLERLRWAQRVTVVDSYSTDSTIEIARGFSNVTILQRPFDDFASQCNFGLAEMQTEWVLALDADYILGEGFEQELASLTLAEDVGGCYARFRYVIFSRALRASLYPPRAVLFRRKLGTYLADGHAHKLSFQGESLTLKSAIYHDDRKPLSRWLQSQDKYAQLEVEKLLSEPKANLRIQDRLRLSLVPAVPLTFFYTLFVKGVVLDGWRGWYYALQRAAAEVILALRLLEKRFHDEKP
ncbi:MAG: glycosyltransferase family 2 protein [Verrucomicrobia bacterium]|nr:glycosyltransferase family 2 protein [Verrucomicrobiota bacterium]